MKSDRHVYRTEYLSRTVQFTIVWQVNVEFSLSFDVSVRAGGLIDRVLCSHSVGAVIHAMLTYLHLNKGHLSYLLGYCTDVQSLVKQHVSHYTGASSDRCSLNMRQPTRRDLSVVCIL